MKRLIDHFLLEWKKSDLRQPLLLRGARQVGKTYAVQEFGKTYESFVEINFETSQKARMIFDQDLDPQRIINAISSIALKPIIPGKTLLFLDEIQVVPDGITALRYFYEKMPELHVIAAGSLIDFAIQKVGVPVGRIQFAYMYPMSFIEFLGALDAKMAIKEILSNPLESPQSEIIHARFLDLLAEYLAIGGMPRVIACWKTKKDLYACSDIPHNLINAYKYDFVEYAKNNQVKYLDRLFAHIPYQLSKRFKFSEVGEFKKRELAPCVDLLSAAGVVHYVTHTSAHGIPLGAGVDLHTFKLILLDVALSQFILDLKTGNWFLNPLEEFVNKGQLVESFVGQELLAYANPMRRTQLYYWKREVLGSEAEVDYVVQLDRHIIPIEVKSGKGSTLKSMQLFLESHPQSPYGIRFSTQNYSIYQNIHSYPLYAIAKVMSDDNDELRQAIQSLM